MRAIVARIAAIRRSRATPLAAIRDLLTGCAVGAHAEATRLTRIETIAADPRAPADVRASFQRILGEERFHERAFRVLAGADAMRATAGAHASGRNALGLVAKIRAAAHGCGAVSASASRG